MEYSPREPKNLTNKACETEAVKVNSSNIHMNKSAEAHESLPPKESDQEDMVGEISLRYQLGSDPNVTDNANANEIGSGKLNLDDPTMVARDENTNAEKPALFSSVYTRKMCADSGRVQLGSNHPLGMTLSENIFKNGI